MAVRKRRAPRASKASSGDRQAAAKRAAAELVQDLRGRGVDRAKIGGFDLDGVLRGKYVSLDKLESALGKGFGFCDVIFGWDVADALYDNAKVTGWHTGYPDAQAVLDPATLRTIPWEPGVAAMLADFRTDEGAPHPACPRSLLKRVIARAEKLGYRPMVGAEYEFYLFKETRDSLQEKAFRRLAPLDPGKFGYSWVRSGQDAELMRDIQQGMRDFDIELEGLHTETGPGVYEAAIAPWRRHCSWDRGSHPSHPCWSRQKVWVGSFSSYRRSSRKTNQSRDGDGAGSSITRSRSRQLRSLRPGLRLIRVAQLVLNFHYRSEADRDRLRAPKPSHPNTPLL
jgi:hypothetical protein